MKAKHLFLTLTMLFVGLSAAWSASPVTDDILQSSFVDAEEDESRDVSVSGHTHLSDASYSGKLRFYYDDDEEDGALSLKTDGSCALSSTVSGGVLKTVSVTWATWAVKSGKSAIQVYARNSSAYDGTETRTKLSTDPNSTLVATITYPATTTSDLSASKWKFVSLVSDGTSPAPAFSALHIQWVPPTKYGFTKAGDFPDGVTIKVNGQPGTKKKPYPTVEPGELVEVNVLAKSGYQVKGFSFGDMDFDFECFGYLDEDEDKTFYIYMPDDDVELNAIVDDMPVKVDNVATFTEDAVAVVSTTVESGATKTIDFQLTYYNDVGSGVLYDGEVTCTSSNASTVQVVSYTYEPTTGAGTITIKGLAGTTADVNVVAAKTGSVFETATPITVTLVPRQAALIAKVGDKYYAMCNDVDASGVASAQEVLKGLDGTYYYYPTKFGATAIANYTWKIMDLDEEGETFTIQNPSDDKYLELSLSKLKLQDGSFTWMKDGGFLIGTTGSGYNPTFKTATEDFGAVRYDFTYGVFDVQISAMKAVKLFSTAITPTSNADTKDARPRFSDDYYATLTMLANAPIAWTSGATFYTLAGKLVSGSGDAEVLTGIVLEEVEETEQLEKGHSYMFHTNADVVDIFYDGSDIALNAYTGDDDGFVGCLIKDGSVKAVPGIIPRSNGYFGMRENKLSYIASGTPTMTRYHAWVYADELSVYVEPPTPSPRRRMVLKSTDFADEPSTPTAIDELIDDSKLINWDEPVYNVMGMRVGKGATGVLIQNGKKFFVQ